jgi:hypothetical protein
MVAVSTPVSAQTFEPYGKAAPANAIYNLLFCDDLSAFQPASNDAQADWQLLLFGPGQDPVKIAALANDTATESRVRAIAFTWLRTHGHETPKGVVLGVIVEVPLNRGLDVLATYADGSIRYINQTGKMVIVEPGGIPVADQQAKRLIELAQPVVARIGPWDKERLSPPTKPNIRITFVVSNGLHFGEGPFEVMERDPLAGPLVQQATRLMALVIDKADAQPAV